MSRITEIKGRNSVAWILWLVGAIMFLSTGCEDDLPRASEARSMYPCTMPGRSPRARPCSIRTGPLRLGMGEGAAHGV